jgi:hypothetical protein
VEILFEKFLWKGEKRFMNKANSKDFLVTRKLRDDVPDLLLLRLWELYEEQPDAVKDNPQVFHLVRVLGQNSTQVIMHKVNEKKVVKHSFQTVAPASAKIVIYDIDGAVIMLSEDQAEEVLKQYCKERGCLYEEDLHTSP